MSLGGFIVTESFQFAAECPIEGCEMHVPCSDHDGWEPPNAGNDRHECTSARCTADHEAPSFQKRDTATGRFFADTRTSIPESVGERVRMRREQAGISPSELARRAGISKSYLSEMEHILTDRPSADLVYRLADALGTTVADLLGRPEQHRP